MHMDQATWRRLEDKAAKLRELCLDTVVWAGSGHIGGSLSSMDLLTVLYHEVMDWSAERLDDPARDRFVLSKGHIGVGYAPVLAEAGCFPVDWLKEYNHTGSPLGIHPDASKVPGVEASTGSLGHGLGLALGMAIASRINKHDYRVYCLLGDGECDEGSVWEAAMAAAHFQVGNLIAFVDRNKAMIDGPTEEIMNLEPFAEKWKAFGWHVQEIDGQDIPGIYEAIMAAQGVEDAPSMIILDTVKGAGIDFIEGDYKWHYGSFDGDRYDKAKESLQRYHERRVARIGG